MNVLIVDDEEEIGLVLSLELKFAGHNSVSFDSTQAAQNYILSNQTIDVIICDFQMPKMNGLDFYHWVRAHNFTGLFYILTGEPTMDIKHLLELGISEVLFKPQDLDRLSQLIK